MNVPVSFRNHRNAKANPTAMSIHRSALFSLLMFTIAVSTAPGRTAHADDTERAEVSKTVGDHELKLRIFTPPGHSVEDRRPAIVFFFGGGWRGGSTNRFVNHCRFPASLGYLQGNPTVEKFLAELKQR